MNSNDSEQFVDVPKNALPPADTWETLSVNQLIETKNTLTNLLIANGRNPAIASTLQNGIHRLDALISSRSS